MPPKIQRPKLANARYGDLATFSQCPKTPAGSTGRRNTLVEPL